jgi:hypothetical protein
MAVHYGTKINVNNKYGPYFNYMFRHFSESNMKRELGKEKKL